jgi:butyrate kinase
LRFIEAYQGLLRHIQAIGTYKSLLRFIEAYQGLLRHIQAIGTYQGLLRHIQAIGTYQGLLRLIKVIKVNISPAYTEQISMIIFKKFTQGGSMKKEI